jgi:anti-sigma factor ChrR (cupin superfamily)
VAVELAHAERREALHQRQVGRLVGRHVEVGGAEQERLVALVGAALDQVGRLGVGARDDDARARS